MTSALKRFYSTDDEAHDRELRIFRTCNNKVGRLIRWNYTGEDNTNELRELALSQGGLYNAEMRQSAWPALLGTHEDSLLPSLEELSSKDLDLMQKDVQRSALFHSETMAGAVARGEHRFEDMQRKLLSVLYFAISGPSDEKGKDKPCYYQGLHDVAFVLLSNLKGDEVAASGALRKLLRTHLQDASRTDFGNVTFVLDSFLMPLIYSLDPEVYSVLIESDVPVTNAILPWLITLFAHSVQDGAVASRLMDAFIAEQNPMLPFYVAVALLLHPALRPQLLQAAYDPVTMHLTIHSLPRQLKNDFARGDSGEVIVTAQEVIDNALEIMRKHPSESLLRFLGPGLSKRSRRRLFNRASRISMLQTPAVTPSVMLTAKHFLHDHAEKTKRTLRKLGKASASTSVHITKRAISTMHHVWTTSSVLYGEAKYLSSNIVDATKILMSVLQVLLLFILLPKTYVKQLYFSLQEPSVLYQNKPVEGKKWSNDDKDDEMPEMIRSTSTASISPLANNDLSASDMSFDLDYSQGSLDKERYVDGALVV